VRTVRKYIFVIAGGWHVLREFSIHSWDYRQALQHLHALYGVSPFFKVSVVPDPRDPIKSIIQVRGETQNDRNSATRECEQRLHVKI
jgi:hypothetical protein